MKQIETAWILKKAFTYRESWALLIEAARTNRADTTPPTPPVTLPPMNLRRHQLAPGECSYCDREREKSNMFHPPHDASPRCESGKHPHCSCDTCF